MGWTSKVVSEAPNKRAAYFTKQTDKLERLAPNKQIPNPVLSLTIGYWY